ncbi:hypothetical protein BMF94_2502 [Rhodotorula taiwanensis]|uniref:Ribosomal protein S6 n=1 Tax=Rhodotorula taiwanensis TaxID=741276 RepID=A0A2S5BC18_9BASI|nr:hypothetical protein BMF94_2502 [Rhodotorula taiwanensis]
MPLYELVCVAKHHSSLSPLQTLIRTSSALISDNGGVVRHLDHWGTRNLPQRMKVGKRRGGGGGAGEDAVSSTGDYFTLRFDCNPPTLQTLTSRLRLDPSVLRFTTLKIGSTLDQIANAPRARGENRTVKFGRDAPPVASLAAAQGGDAASGLDAARETMMSRTTQAQTTRRAWDEL